MIRDNLSVDIRKVDIRDCILDNTDLVGLSATRQAEGIFECLIDKRRLGKPIVMQIDITDARKRFQRWAEGIAARDPTFTPEIIMRSVAGGNFALSLGFTVEELM